MKTVWLGLSILGLLAAPAAAGPNCRCKANGQEYEIGQLVCLRLPEGSRLARCSMVLNNSSWTKIEDACPTSFNDHLYSVPNSDGNAMMSVAIALPVDSAYAHGQTIKN